MKTNALRMPNRRAPGSRSRIKRGVNCQSVYGVLSLLLVVLLGVLAACGPTEGTDTAAGTAAPTSQASQDSGEIDFIRTFHERIVAGEYQAAYQDFTCQGQAPGAEVGIDEVQQMQILFPWTGLALVEVEPAASSEPAPGTTQTFYQITFESESGVRVTASLLVVNNGDILCIDVQNIMF